MSKNKIIPVLITVFPLGTFAQGTSTITTDNWITSPGIIGVLVLITIVLVVAILILLARFNSYLSALKEKRSKQQQSAYSEELIGLNEHEIDEILKDESVEEETVSEKEE